MAITAGDEITSDFITYTLREIDRALDVANEEDDRAKQDFSTSGVVHGGDEDGSPEAQAETGEEKTRPERAAENLLDRSWPKVFSLATPSHRWSRSMYSTTTGPPSTAPSSDTPCWGLPVALTQYAPERRSGRREAMDLGALRPCGRTSYGMEHRADLFECSTCHYAQPRAAARPTGRRTMALCGAEQKFKARNWIRPPGFAHPYSRGRTSQTISPREATPRAKLVASFPADSEGWSEVMSASAYSSTVHSARYEHGAPARRLYLLPPVCLIELTAIPSQNPLSHTKPYPDRRS